MALWNRSAALLDRLDDLVSVPTLAEQLAACEKATGRPAPDLVAVYDHAEAVLAHVSTLHRDDIAFGPDPAQHPHLTRLLTRMHQRGIKGLMAPD
jgi:hypothetical protein